MNERIRELEKQSYTEVMHELGGRYMAFDKEKFAELIVKECAKMVDTDGDAVMALRMMKHFGVEE